MIDSHRDEIAKLESLYAMNPEGRVFTHLAEACRKAGQLDRARQILEEGLQKHPDYASAHVVLGRVLSDSGEDDAAVGEFRRVLELDRHNLVAMRSLGEIAERAGRTDEAIHYYGELAILDPTDPEIQETLRGLRERPAAAAPEQPPGEESRPEAPAAEHVGEPEDAAAPAIDASTGEAADAGTAVEGIESEATEAFGAEGVGEIAPVEGLESVSAEPEPADAWPPASGADLPEWPAGESAGEVEQPGLDGPIDHAAWEEIAAGGTPTGPAAMAPSEEEASGSEPEGDEVQPFVAASAEVTVPLNEDHLRFVPPGLFGRPAERLEETEVPGAEGGQGAGESGPTGQQDEPESHGAESPAQDEPEPESAISAARDDPDREIEGRWEAPGSAHGDYQAERERPTDHSGEWIPEDRWEWVSASADASGSAGRPDEEPDGESSPEPGAEAAPVVWDEETSFAGLTDDDDAPSAYGIDDEVSFAGLTDDDSDDAALGSGTDEEVAFDGIADSEPVDSFEEGAAAVLDAYARSEAEPEGDDAATEPAAGPAFVTDPRASDDDAPVSWVTESEDDGDLVITETLAEIYASQGLYDRAAAVYRRLIDLHPDDDRLHARLADLESATGWAGEAGEQGGAGSAEEERDAFLERVESAWTGREGATKMEDSPYAWAEPEAEASEPGPRVAEYFAGLLAWRPTEAVPSTGTEPSRPGASSLTEDWYTEESEREPADDAEDGEAGREGEEDLEMFRSWLKSLKK